jgi:dTDP-4-dehydrorhamnose 3,5-epimerase
VSGTAPIAALDSLELVFPDCPKGIGTIIRAPESPELIDGVHVRSCALWPDDRGYFLEVLRMGEGPAAAFPPATTQVSAALSYPGTIKAFHYHLQQHDYWTVAAGLLQVALVDLRRGSRTFGVRNTFYVGALRPWQILIPPGVGHGYKAIGTTPALLVYATDRFYNPADEGRLAHNDARINYDWETQFK